MRNTIILCLITIVSVLLSACTTPDPNAKNHYHTKEPLAVDIHIPEQFSIEAANKFHVKFTQGSQGISHPDFVHFIIWKHDGSMNSGMVEAINEGDGIYSFQTNITNDGLYYVQVHASYNGELLLPTKQFIVGNLTATEKQIILDNASTENTNGGNHH